MSGVAGNAQGFNAIRVLNALIPPEGPKSIGIPLYFESVNEETINLDLTITSGRIALVQSVFIDASLNSGTFTLTSEITGQVITVPPGFQGYYPILAGQSPRFIARNTVNELVKLYLLNIPVPAANWDAQLINPAGFTVGRYDATLPVLTDGEYSTLQLDENGRLIVSANSAVYDWVNFSGSIAVVNTPQTLIPANPLRRGFWVQNNSTGNLIVTEVSLAASTGIIVFPGALYETPLNGFPVVEMTIQGATVAQAFSAREW